MDASKKIKEFVQNKHIRLALFFVPSGWVTVSLPAVHHGIDLPLPESTS